MPSRKKVSDIAETIGETERIAETEVINISKLDKMSKFQKQPPTLPKQSENPKRQRGD